MALPETKAKIRLEVEDATGPGLAQADAAVRRTAERYKAEFRQASQQAIVPMQRDLEGVRKTVGTISFQQVRGPLLKVVKDIGNAKSATDMWKAGLDGVSALAAAIPHPYAKILSIAAGVTSELLEHVKLSESHYENTSRLAALKAEQAIRDIKYRREYDAHVTRNEDLALDRAHEAKLLEISGKATAQEVLDLKVASITAAQQASVWTAYGADAETKALELRKQQNLEREKTILLAKAEADKAAAAPKRRGGGGSRFDAARAELDLQLLQLDAAARMQEFALDEAKAANDMLYPAGELVRLEQERLRIREEAIDAMPERTRRQQIEKERAWVQLSIDQIGGLAAETELMRDVQRSASDERIAGIEQEIAKANALGQDSFVAEDKLWRARVAAAEQFGTTADVAAVKADWELSRIEATQAAYAAKEEQVAAQFDAEIRREQMRLEVAAEKGEATYQIEQSVIAQQEAKARALGDADALAEALHAKEISRLREQQRVRAEVTSAIGGFAQAGFDLSNTIAQHEIKNDKKREQASLRLQGVKAMAIGALEVVEAAAAYASLNVVQGALHTAAAAIAFVQGGYMLAGKVPRGGGSAGSAGGDAAASEGPQTSAANKVPGSVPGGSSKAKQAGQGAQTGGTTYNGSVTYYVMGTLDQDAAAALGNAVSKGGYSREGGKVAA